MEPIFPKVQENENISTIKNNYYYLNYNENLSSYIFNIIDYYRKNNRTKDTDISSIFFNESTLHLMFISLSLNKIYLTLIPATSKEAKIKEIELIPEKKGFCYGYMKLSEDKKHIVLFDKNENKIFILFDYIRIISSDDVDKIKLDNLYENENMIIDIKFNFCSSDNNLILYGINCDNNNLSLFNNNYLNKEFNVYFDDDFIDFQIIKNAYDGYDLYVMNSYGNFRIIKNIQDVKNIPKSDKSELIEKIKIYDRIVHNINNCPKILKNDYIKFYFQPQNDINEKIKKEKTEKETNIMTVLRLSTHTLDIGILISGKIFLIKKYYFDEENESQKSLKNKLKNDDENLKKENFNSIVPIENYLNKYLIIYNNIIYFVDIPSLFNLYLPLSEGNSYNEELKKQEILLIINEIISKITLSVVLKLPFEQDKNFSITYNFYKGNLFCIQRQNNNLNNLMIKIYNFELDDPTLYENESNNAIIYDKENNNNIREYMESTLQKIKIEIDNLKKREIKDNNINEYYKKLLEEYSVNINNLINIYNNNNDIDSKINQINNCYKNLYLSIQLYGQKIKDKNEFINDCLSKRVKFEKNMTKDEENLNNAMHRINKKLKMIEENQNKIMKLRDESNNNMHKYYLMNMNNKNTEKNYTNELIKRINNHTLKNIEFLKEKMKDNNYFDRPKFEELQNFPLSMKYLNNNQINEMKNIINMMKQLKNILLQYHEKLKIEKKQ